MKTFIKTSSAVQNAFAILAIFALAISTFAMAVPKAFADHDPYGGVEMKKIILCHDESGDSESYHSSGGVSVSSVINGGHGNHGTDIIPPFHYDGGTYPGQNWNEVNEDIWNLGACDGDGEIPVDVCPNLDGVQESLPSGYEFDESSNCVLIGEPVDVCPNIDGDQATVPDGLIVNEAGNCVEPPADVCPNLDGNQETLPEGYVFDEEENCVVADDNDEIITICKYDSGNENAPLAWDVTLTNDKEGEANMTFELATDAETGCVSQSVDPEDGPFFVIEASEDEWHQEEVNVNGGNVIGTQEEGVYMCSFFQPDLQIVDRIDALVVIDPGYRCDFYNEMDPQMCVVTVVSNEEDVVTNDSDGIAELLTVINGGWDTIADAFWIWGDDPVNAPTDVDETQTFTKTFAWDSAAVNIDTASLEIAADNGFKITLNGNLVSDQLADEFNYGTSETFDVASFIQEGNNTLVIEVVNMAEPESTPESNPAGLIYKLVVTDDDESCDGPTDPEELTCEFSSSDTSVEDGEEFTLTWNTTNADEVTIDEGIGSVALDGSLETSVNSDTTYTLTASRGEGEGQEEVTCVVDINNESGGGGGGGGGSRISLSDDDDDEDEDDEPTPQVLGEATSVLPAGAPATGAGGSAPVTVTLPSLLAVFASTRGDQKTK